MEEMTLSKVVEREERADKKCSSCGKRRDDVRRRTIYAHNYEGPCGDSFCYASCDMTACRPATVRVCGDCSKKLGRER